MRQLCFAVMACLLLTRCEDILPVDNIDLCDGDEPASAECGQCSGERKAAGCPQCRGDSPGEGCENASGVSGGGRAGSSSGGTSGGDSGSSAAGSAGEAGGSGTASAGNSGSGGVSPAGSGGTGGSMSGSGGAGSGGTSGDGGSSGSDSGTEPECVHQTDCNNPAPQCSSGGKCVACDGADACAEREGSAHCDLRTGSDSLGQCVECTSHAHCTGSAAPQCNAAGACEACTANDACSDRAGTTLCETEAGAPSEGTCVECLTHADCKDITKPECSPEGSCVACTGDAACSARPDTTKCNLYDGAEAKGHCVKCTGENETAACGGKSCKRSTGTCTNTTLRDVGLCKPCEADSECAITARCVPHSYDNQSLGSFCFYSDPDGDDCADTNSTRKPYSRRLIDIASIDGAEGPFCAPITTCQAIYDANTQKPCVASEECGVGGIVDAACQDQKCTYACGQSHDCLPDNAPGSFSECSAPSAGFCR